LPESGNIDPKTLVDPSSGPIELEIGPGRGWFMIERLENEPGIAMIGLEIRRKWASIVDERLRKRGFGARARVFAEDARLVLPRFAPHSIRRIFVHFPDPWWKKRHRKRLLVTPHTAQQIVRVLEPGGELFIQTDVAERALAYEALFSIQPGIEPFGDAARVDENPYLAHSPRERRALRDGLPVVRLRFRSSPVRRLDSP
jgi:tRNA (guanine-N7-)-methyltransferase